MSQQNTNDLQAAEILRQALPVAQARQMGGAADAGTVAGIPSTTSSTLVDADGKVRRLWLVGDPWTDEFYFDWRPA